MKTTNPLWQSRYFLGNILMLYFFFFLFLFSNPLISQTNTLTDLEELLVPASAEDRIVFENTLAKINQLKEGTAGISEYCEAPDDITSTETAAVVTSEICSLTEAEFDDVVGSSAISVLVFPPANLTIQNKKLWIRSSLIFDGEIIFRNCEIKLDPGVVLIQRSGHSLSLENSELSSCEGIWLGVGAENNGTNIDLIASGSKIIGAAIGLFSFDPFSVDFSIIETTFDRNHIGVAVDTDILGSPGGTFSQFKSNTFDCSSPIPGTTDGITRAGLLLSGQVVANANGNTYKNLEFGVLSEKGNSHYEDAFSSFSNLLRDGIFMKKGSVDLVWTKFTNYGRNGIGMAVARNVDLNNCDFRLDEDFVPFLPPGNDPNASTLICALGLEGFTMNGRLNIRNSGFYAQSEDSEVINTVGQYIAGILLGGGTIGANTKISIFQNEWYYITGKESSCIELNGEFPTNTETQIFNNEFLFDPFRFSSDFNDANTIYCRNGDKNNLSIYANHFEGDKSNDFLEDPATEHRGNGIWLTGSNGENNNVSDNNFPTNFSAVFNDDFSEGIVAREFKNTKFCSNYLGNSRHSMWLMLADMSTKIFANTMVTSNRHFVINTCSLGLQKHTGQKYRFKYAFGGPHASCIPEDASAMNEIEVHTDQSIENDPPPGFVFFSEYYPSRISPESNWFAKTSLEHLLKIA